jgi:hypothetical protein
MWLINAKSLRLEEFIGDQIPKYASLSHTWGSGEVTLQSMQTQAAEQLEAKPGYKKITETAKIALQDGLEHVWVDTCCIDKSSSAELSEAINSMMAWYQQSEVCYTYLVDVPSGLPPAEHNAAFAKSRWFTRGWTLQELLAPPKLVFLFTDWSVISTRDALAEEVSRITGIDRSFMRHRFVETRIDNRSANSLRARLDSASIAQRMSWASRRQTTRVEDIAYCLLGIFGINMPLLYGEGPVAL